MPASFPSGNRLLSGSAAISSLHRPFWPDFIHLQVEAAKLAFADRDTFYGDPKFVEVPIDVLLSDGYNDARVKLITNQASLEIRPGSIAGFGWTSSRYSLMTVDS